LRPPLPIADRTLAAPFEVARHRLPVGTVVARASSCCTTHADRYPEPPAFRPERFLARPQDLWLDPLRRGRAPLPGHELCHLRDGGGAPHPARVGPPASGIFVPGNK